LLHGGILNTDHGSHRIAVSGNCGAAQHASASAGAHPGGRGAGFWRPLQRQAVDLSSGSPIVAVFSVACRSSLAEETIKGWFHGQSLVDVFRDLAGWLQIAATALLLWLVLVPYLSFIRLGETLGEGRLQAIVWGVAPSQSPKAVS
jgi:hypothetical protein